MSHKHIHDKLAELVSGLPEVYQPVYGHPKLSGKVSRPCCDRLQDVIKVHDALRNTLGRPLKVLDLGCAQGFFSFSLAERDAVVHGIDYLDKNIAVCKTIAEEHPDFEVRFEMGRVEEVIERLEKDQYDLVLGLSVFHHIIHEKGAEAVRALLDRAAGYSGVLVVESALREEPLYWAPAQPEDPRSLFGSIAFVHELARHETHLAPILRPLYAASNRYWVLGEHAGQFESWAVDPHVFARGTHEGSRRYFFSPDHIVKIYRFDHQRGAYNRTEFTRETDFLKNPPAGFTAPACLVSGSNDTEGWVVLERNPGRLLLDILLEGAELNRMAILCAVLGQLAVLEAAGLYHNDVRAWNILVAEDGTARLIDLGSISTQENDCVWPENRFLSFFIFVHELTTGVIDQPEPLRNIAITPYSLPSPYREWGIALWKQPFRDWSFDKMNKALDSFPKRSKKSELEMPADVWARAIETAIQSQKQFMQHLGTRIAASEHWPEDIVKVLERTEAGLLKAASRVQQVEAEAGARILKIEEKAEARAQQLQSELDATWANAEVLNVQLGEKSAALASRDATLAEQRDHNQRLENEWNAAMIKIEELNQAFQETLRRQHEAQIAMGKAETAAEARVQKSEVRAQQLQSELDVARANAEVLNVQLGEKSVALASRDATLVEQRANNQRLEKERNADRAKTVELNQAFQETLRRQHEAQIATGKAEARAQQLQREMDAVRANAGALNAQLGEKSAALASRDATLAEQREHNQRLENECNAAKVKIDELHQSNHHWWTLSESRQKELSEARAKIDELHQSNHHWWVSAERLGRELQALRASRSVRWTVPLRWMERQVSRLRAEGPSARLKALVKKIARHIREPIPEQVQTPLKLETATDTSSQASEKKPEQIPATAVAKEAADISHLTPQARQIYADLKAAIERRRKETR